MEDSVLLLTEEEIETNAWVLDTGASFHVTSCREFFKTFQNGVFGKVLLADNKSLDIVGIGDVLLKLTNGKSWLLRDVRYVPQLKHNSISAGQLSSQECGVTFELSRWKVTKEARVIAEGRKLNTLYVLESHNEVGVANAMVDSDTKP